MTEKRKYRGHDLEISETENQLDIQIDGQKKKYLKTEIGYQIGYQTPKRTLLEAATSFLDTQPPAISYRRSFTDLSDNERRQLGEALNELYDNGASNNLIDSNAELHDANFLNGIHWGPAFLPWHRDFLRKLELKIQSIHADLTLPYWDWTRQDSRDLDQGPWKSIFGGRNNNGGMFNHWNYSRNSSPGRWVLPKLPDVIGELKATTFQDFRRLETGSHVPGHTWTGGTMATGESPRDPLFYLHHCNLDRLWAIWQLNNQGADQYTLDPINSDNVPEAAVPLNDQMIGGATPASMLDHEALGYLYARDTALEEAWADDGNGRLITGS